MMLFRPAYSFMKEMGSSSNCTLSKIFPLVTQLVMINLQLDYNILSKPKSGLFRYARFSRSQVGK